MAIVESSETHGLTFEEILEKTGINENTARKYLPMVVPEGGQIGKKRWVKYNEDTLNTFHVLKMIIDKKALNRSQIVNVLKLLGREGVNRVVNENEPITLEIAEVGKDGKLKVSSDYLHRYGNGKAILLDGDEVRRVEVDVKKPAEKPKQPKWKVHAVSERLEVRYKGELSSEQMNELKVVSRILKSVVEQR